MLELYLSQGNFIIDVVTPGIKIQILFNELLLQKL